MPLLPLAMRLLTSKRSFRKYGRITLLHLEALPRSPRNPHARKSRSCNNPPPRIFGHGWRDISGTRGPTISIFGICPDSPQVTRVPSATSAADKIRTINRCVRGLFVPRAGYHRQRELFRAALDSPNSGTSTDRR